MTVQEILRVVGNVDLNQLLLKAFEAQVEVKLSFARPIVDFLVLSQEEVDALDSTLTVIQRLLRGRDSGGQVTLNAQTRRSVSLILPRPLGFVLFIILRLFEGYVGTATGGVLSVTTTFHSVREPISAA